MNIMTFIFWLIAFGNSLFAQGYTYDLSTGQFIPPASGEVRRVSDSPRIELRDSRRLIAE